MRSDEKGVVSGTVMLSGYVEGYYGALLTWEERARLLAPLAQYGMNTYLYAPKEDPRHRFRWRQVYDDEWRSHFRNFCQQANRVGVRVLGGIAPGNDFDFREVPGGADYEALINKCTQLLEDGADRVVLLLDDVDEAPRQRLANGMSEGQAHGMLANCLNDWLNTQQDTNVPPLFLVPRVYANELHQHWPDYLPDLAGALNEAIITIYTGSDIVAEQVNADDIQKVVPEWKAPIVLWDNLYANDYCPRRLFVGPWSNRSIQHSILVNPTGMIETDLLLLSIVGKVYQGLSPERAWRKAIDEANIPRAFYDVAGYFRHPFFNTGSLVSGSSNDTEGSHAGEDPAKPDKALKALDRLLWSWKSPLAREWYPYLFSCKQDLQTASGSLSNKGIHKLYSTALATKLSKSPDSPS